MSIIVLQLYLTIGVDKQLNSLSYVMMEVGDETWKKKENMKLMGICSVVDVVGVFVYVCMCQSHNINYSLRE